MKRKLLLTVLLTIWCAYTSVSQCSMCRAALESEGNKVKAEAVNDGIVYLMAIPYLLVAGIMYYVYTTRQKSERQKSSQKSTA
jgi:hypothetical protein